MLLSNLALAGPTGHFDLSSDFDLTDFELTGVRCIWITDVIHLMEISE